MVFYNITKLRSVAVTKVNQITEGPPDELTELGTGWCHILNTAIAGLSPRDVEHLFICPQHPSLLKPEDLWSTI